MSQIRPTRRRLELSQPSVNIEAAITFTELCCLSASKSVSSQESSRQTYDHSGEFRHAAVQIFDRGTVRPPGFFGLIAAERHRFCRILTPGHCQDAFCETPHAQSSVSNSRRLSLDLQRHLCEGLHTCSRLTRRLHCKQLEPLWRFPARQRRHNSCQLPTTRPI